MSSSGCLCCDWFCSLGCSAEFRVSHSNCYSKLLHALWYNQWPVPEVKLWQGKALSFRGGLNNTVALLHLIAPKEWLQSSGLRIRKDLKANVEVEGRNENLLFFFLSSHIGFIWTVTVWAAWRLEIWNLCLLCLERSWKFSELVIYKIYLIW